MEDREKLIGLHGLFLTLLPKVYKFLPTPDQELMSAAGYALLARLTPIFGMLQSNNLFRGGERSLRPAHKQEAEVGKAVDVRRVTQSACVHATCTIINAVYNDRCQVISTQKPP